MPIGCRLNKSLQLSIVVTTYIAGKPTSLHALRFTQSRYDVNGRMNFEVMGVKLSDWPPNARL
ncbi:hypothetical protein CP976_18865 [Streptomyces coeruleorubidus]|uniref:Uncharacterized protein n=1 Tax=Streptomyces coeruleorubidus TaxID=116188 RepID=A0A5J6I1V2_STRC4|nr:hypothetical protein CP976_18865 [Streptomyces coeruleorubidus]